MIELRNINLYCEECEAKTKHQHWMSDDRKEEIFKCTKCDIETIVEE